FQYIGKRGAKIHAALQQGCRDAFFQLVLYPVKTSSLITDLHITAGRHQLYAAQGRASANDVAARVRELFHADKALSDQYNALAGGRWNHMMGQTHTGFTFW